MIKKYFLLQEPITETIITRAIKNILGFGSLLLILRP
jgi:hypothetical protein